MLITHALLNSLLVFRLFGYEITVEQKPKIPVELSYPIIEDKQAGEERMVKIRLNMRASKEALREIALAVKAKEHRQFEATYIFYYLPNDFPDYEPDPWATSNFNPTLDINMIGMSLEEEASLRRIPIAPKGTILGKWLIDDGTDKQIAVLRDDGGIKLSKYDNKGIDTDEEMEEVEADSGRSFQRSRNGKPASKVYNVDRDGCLRTFWLGKLEYAAKRLDGAE